MGRFRWLELDESLPDRTPPEPDRRDMDEHACLAMGDQHLRQGSYERALQYYSRALRYAIDLEPAWVGQVLCLLGLGESVEADIWADRGLARFQDSPDLLAAKAMAQGRLRGAGAAMPYSDAALTVKGREVGPYPWVVRGTLLSLRRDGRASAQRCFDKAVEIGGRDWYTHYLIGRALMSGGRFGEALVRLIAASQIEPRSTLVLCAMGECYERLGDLAAANRVYHAARRIDPRCLIAVDRLAALQRVGPLGRAWRRLWGRG
jgi:tetratricopeptide (TPR) repeat protein